MEPFLTNNRDNSVFASGIFHFYDARFAEEKFCDAFALPDGVQEQKITPGFVLDVRVVPDPRA